MASAMSSRGRSGPMVRNLSTVEKIQRGLPVTNDELAREFAIQNKNCDFYLDMMTEQIRVVEARANGQQVPDPAYPYIPMQKFMRIASEWRLVVRAFQHRQAQIAAANAAAIAAYNAAQNATSNNDASGDDAASDSE